MAKGNLYGRKSKADQYTQENTQMAPIQAKTGKELIHGKISNYSSNGQNSADRGLIRNQPQPLANAYIRDPTSSVEERSMRQMIKYGSAGINHGGSPNTTDTGGDNNIRE